MGGNVIAFDTPARAPTVRPKSEVRFYGEGRLGVAQYVPLYDTGPLVSEFSPYNGATDVSVTQSSINFDIRNDQGNLMSYTVTTSPNVGGGSGSGLANGRYSVPISGLTPNTVIQWTIIVSDGSHQISQSHTFKTSMKPTWYDQAWPYRKTVTIASAYLEGSPANFPLLIDVTDADLAARAKADGSDILFTSVNGVKLDHQIVSYGAGHLVAYVRLPVLGSSEDTVVLMYYGNGGAASQANPSGVWDSGSSLVLHLDAQTLDSTVNGNNGNAQGGVTKGVAGVVGPAYTFDGATGFIQVPSSNTISGFPSALTVSLWVRFTTVNSRQTLVSKSSGTTGNSFFLEYWNAQSTYGKVLHFQGFNGTIARDWYCPFSPSANIWYYVTVVWTYGGVPMFYVNGAQVATVVSPGGGNMGRLNALFKNDGTDLLIGRSWDSTTRFLRGSVDEVSVSSVVRSSDWIEGEYRNINSPGTFYSVSAQEGSSIIPDKVSLTLTVSRPRGSRQDGSL